MNSLQLEKVIRNMRAEGLKQLLLCAPMNIKYLTGRMINPGERLLALIVRDTGEATLVANKLFAQSSLAGAGLLEYSDTDDFAAVLSQCVEGGLLGVDKEFKCRFALPLMEKRPDVRLTLGSKCVDAARMIKTEEELIRLRESSLKNDEVLKNTLAGVREGVTESDVADVYRRCAADAGASGVSFEPLICFGKNAAEPHHDTDKTRLKQGDAVILDVGLLYGDYCSDMTRTVFYGHPTDEQRRVYEIVKAANAAGRAAVRPGVPLRNVDAAARKVIEDAGYGEYFIHRTGHGIGLEVHEFPDVSQASDAVCAPGMVFSVEPGIYLPGRFGVRIEDLVEVTQDGARTLNQLPRELISI